MGPQMGMMGKGMQAGGFSVAAVGVLFMELNVQGPGAMPMGAMGPMGGKGGNVPMVAGKGMMGPPLGPD